MNFVALGLVLAWVAIIAGAWLGWQLIRQNGRVLLRLDDAEERLHALEFGEAEELADKSSPQDPANRFGNRSLARSKINRSGLKAGTPAPDFRLPRLDGRGDLSLEEVRGRRVLLVFSDPHCGPCNLLAPQLEKFHRERPKLEVVMISRGEPKENRAKVKEHGLTFTILLQQQWEISRKYAIFATPIAYLIDEAGIIGNEVAVGAEPILALMERASPHANEPELAVH
jgi:peroxiredoxin